VRRGGNGSDAADFITCSVLNMIGRELIVQHWRYVGYINHSRGKAKARGHQRAKEYKVSRGMKNWAR
jgi:hypothetical protein